MDSNRGRTIDSKDTESPYCRVPEKHRIVIGIQVSYKFYLPCLHIFDIFIRLSTEDKVAYSL